MKTAISLFVMEKYCKWLPMKHQVLDWLNLPKESDESLNYRMNISKKT